MKNVGIIGAGLMGSGIAGNLIAAGYPVKIFTRGRTAEDPVIGTLLNSGASLTHSLEQICCFSEVLVTCLPDSPAVEEIISRLLSLQGLPVEILFDFTTARPESTRKLAMLLKQRGISMLDCPMTGGPKQAKEGKLGLAIGGNKDVYTRWIPLISKVSDKFFYSGPQGSGNQLKLLNNFLSIMNTCAAAAASSLLEKSDTDRDAFYEFISCSGGNSNAFQKTMDKIVNDNFSLTFALNLARKDLSYAKELFDAEGGFSILDSTLGLLDQAVKDGYGNSDIGAVYHSIKKHLVQQPQPGE